MRLGVLVLVTFLGALAAVACGDGDSSSAEVTATAEVIDLPSPTAAAGTAEPTAEAVATAVPDVCDPNPSPVNPADPNIVVRSPEPGQVVTSPLLVTGLARVFEGQFNVTLYGEIGGVIAQAPGQAEMGEELSPFETELTFAVGREQPACLWVFDDSPADGSPIDVVQVPIALAPSP